MNGTLKRASVACLLMFGLLMININYLQAVKAEDLRTDGRNQRSFFARYETERGMITARLRSGRLLKAERGGYAGFGAPPYGTRAADGELVPEPKEVRAIERARALRASGASLRSIAEVLATEGFAPRRADCWHPETLRRLLERAT